MTNVPGLVFPGRRVMINVTLNSIYYFCYSENIFFCAHIYSVLFDAVEVSFGYSQFTLRPKNPKCSKTCIDLSSSTLCRWSSHCDEFWWERKDGDDCRDGLTKHIFIALRAIKKTSFSTNSLCKLRLFYSASTRISTPSIIDPFTSRLYFCWFPYRTDLV